MLALLALLAVAESVELVVFGAHLRGGPLVHQLTDQGARWAGEVTTAPRYRMSVLPTVPAKPAITRVPDGQPGAALSGHRRRTDHHARKNGNAEQCRSHVSPILEAELDAVELVSAKPRP